MPIVDVLRIKIEKIDKYTHLPVEGDEAEKYIIECNTSAELSPVYIGGNEIVYESDNSLVDYNVENFTMYGVNVVIQTATFSLKRHAFLTGGIFLDQDAIYPRKNMFGLIAHNVWTNAANAYDTRNEYALSVYGQLHRIIYDLVDGELVPRDTFNTSAMSKTINGYVNNHIYIPSDSYPTRESWVNYYIQNNNVYPYARMGLIIGQYGVAPLRDMVNGDIPIYFSSTTNALTSTKDVHSSWMWALDHPESDNIHKNDQAYLHRTVYALYNEKQWRQQNGYTWGGWLFEYVWGKTAAYNGTGQMQSVVDTKYNFAFFFGWQNAMTINDSFGTNPEIIGLINDQNAQSMYFDHFRVIVSLNPSFQTHYSAYATKTATTDCMTTKQALQNALDTDEYLLDYFNPNTDNRIWQDYVNTLTTSRLNVNIYGGNRLEYEFTYTEVTKIKLTVALVLDLDAVDASGFFNQPGTTSMFINPITGVGTYLRAIMAQPIIFERCEVAGQKNLNQVTIDDSYFSSLSEYEEELLQAGTEIPGVVPNTYYSPHSIAPNETDLFATTLYTRDFIGADVNQYYKLYMNNCFSDKQPGLTINQIFNDHEMHIYARDSFITVRPALEISPMTTEEYRQEIERDDST